MPIHARQCRFFCILKYNFMQSKQFKEAVKRREWLDKKEAEGFCTLCIRSLSPHEKTEECERRRVGENKINLSTSYPQ